MLYLWDIENGSENILNYLNLSDGFAKLGACIGVGLYSSGIIDEIDSAKALLEDYINGGEYPLF